MIRDASAPLQVLIIAGIPALRAGLGALLSQDEGIVALDAAPDPSDEIGDDDVPDVIVADAGSLSDAALDALADRYPETPLVTIGGSPSLASSGMLATPGAFLPADIDGAALSAAVRAVSQGLTVISPGLFAGAEFHVASEATAVDDPLTPREREVLALVAEGLPNKAIARELGISEHTAKFHVGSLLGKLGASSRAEAVMLATRRGLLSV